MTRRVKSKRVWRFIKRCVRSKKGRVRVAELARRFNLNPSNVSRGLKQRHLWLEADDIFPWESSSKPSRPDQVRKCRQALALYFLGLNGHQIEQLVGIKSETVSRYVLAVTIPTGDEKHRMFSSYALESLAKELQKAYGMGEHIREVIDYFDAALGFDYFSADPNAFLREFRPYQPSLDFLVCKLRKILKTAVFIHRPSVCILKGKGKVSDARKRYLACKSERTKGLRRLFVVVTP